MREVTIRLRVRRLPEGVFLATSPDVPGLLAQGNTLEETAEYAQDVARMIAGVCIEHGDPLPPALAEAVEQGVINLKVPVGLT